MAISHAGHDHPATPAGRAACRKGIVKAPQSDAQGSVVRTRRTPATTPAKPATARSRVFTDEKAINAARSVRGCPDEWVAGMTRALKLGVGITFAPVTRTGQYEVRITTKLGEVVLLWTDWGYPGWISWRPAGSSVARRIATMNEGIGYLHGKR
jgi:hypothetical protein